MLKRILQHSLYLSAGEAFAKIFGLLTTVYLYRAIGTEGFGSWNFVLAVYAFFHFLTVPGFEIVSSGSIARRRWTIPLVLRNVFYSRGLLALAAAVLMVGFVALTRPSAPLLALTAFQAINLFLLPLSIQFALIGLERMDLIALSKSLQGGATLALVVLLVRSPSDLNLLPVALFGGTIVSLIPVLLFYARRFPCFLRWKGFTFRVSDVRASLSVTLALFMITVYYQSGMVLMEYLQGSREVGLYAAGFRIVLFLSAFQIFVNQSFFPFISRNWRLDSATVRSAVEVGLAGMIAVAAIMTAVVELYAVEVSSIFYHTDEIAIASGLRVTVLAMALVYIEAIPASLLLAVERRKEYLQGVSAGALVSIAANVVLIPPFGFLGAAWAFVGSEAVVFMLVFGSAWRTARFRVRGLMMLAGAGLAVIPLGMVLPRGAALAGMLAVVMAVFVLVVRPLSAAIKSLWSAAPIPH